MMSEAETLTPTETAVVASVSVRDVNRVIDEKILPEALYAVGRDRTRRLLIDSCVFISFYFETSNRLTAEERTRAITAAMPLREQPEWRNCLMSTCKESLLDDWIENTFNIREEFLTINLAPFLKRTRERLSRLFASRELVIEDPLILSGTPVIKGTRIPVYDVASSVSAGLPLSRIRRAYPGLSDNDIELAAIYAEANPPRGRPRRPSGPPAGSVIIAANRVRRRPRT
ncbi:MAG TPA: DUF433 domain-containing protein [Candidatus Angelobacter sp.]|nr:DUF433 domain-containing protein [Candidatus Angelobacter sp.]